MSLTQTLPPIIIPSPSIIQPRPKVHITKAIHPSFHAYTVKLHKVLARNPDLVRTACLKTHALLLALAPNSMDGMPLGKKLKYDVSPNDEKRFRELRWIVSPRLAIKQAETENDWYKSGMWEVWSELRMLGKECTVEELDQFVRCLPMSMAVQ